MPAPVRKTQKSQSQLDYIGGHFESFQKNGQGYIALCPLHDDTNPSLSINEGNGHILVHCHAGCPTEGLLEVVGLSMRDLMPNATWIVATYDYRDEQGELLYQTVRMEPKGFRQRKPKDGGDWDWRTKGVRRVLYCLPELLEAKIKRPVFVVEGEKDADRLRTLGFVATCNVGGAGKWLGEYNKHLAGRRVVILPDNDSAGLKHAHDLVHHLDGVVESIKILELPGLKEKGDVSDWLDTGGTKNKLQTLTRQSPVLSTQLPPAEAGGFESFVSYGLKVLHSRKNRYCPGGTTENSPAVHCWVTRIKKHFVPEGRLNRSNRIRKHFKP